jgi:hypothetical protein
MFMPSNSRLPKAVYFKESLIMAKKAKNKKDPRLTRPENETKNKTDEVPSRIRIKMERPVRRKF